MTRRDFISQTSRALTAVACIPLLSAAMKRNHLYIGLILGTVSEPLKTDWLKTIETIASYGYTHLEFSRHFGESKEECKQTLQRLDLKTFCGGGPMIDLQNRIDERIEFAHYFEQKYVICYWPWTDDGKNKTIDDFKKLGDRLNEIGKRLKDEGLTLAYHNHAIEFFKTEGVIPYDTILHYTDPSLVTMQLDLYWITNGYEDPIKYFKQYPGRFDLCHIKDMDKTPARAMACAGDGILDFQKILKQADRAGLKHFIVEHDNSEDPMACIRSSANYLKKIKI